MVLDQKYGLLKSTFYAFIIFQQLCKQLVATFVFTYSMRFDLAKLMIK